MANKASKRSLSVQEVIDLVQSVDVPVLRIEKDLAIPVSVLQRAMRPDTKKPLPVKYEFLLLDYINKKISISFNKKNTADPLLTESYKDKDLDQSASLEDIETRNYFLKEIKKCVLISRKSVYLP